MKVNPDSNSADYLKHLHEKQRNTVASKQAELQQINKKFEQQEKQIRKQGQQKISAQEIQQKNDLLKVQDRGTATLKKMQVQADLDKIKLAVEHKNILSQSQLRNQDLTDKLSINLQDKITAVNELNQESNEVTNSQIRLISSKANDKIAEEKFLTAIKVQSRHDLSQIKLQDEQDKFNKMIDYQRKEFSTTLEQKNKDQKQVLTYSQRQNKIQLDNTKRTHEHQMAFVRNFNKNKLKQENEAFNKTFQKQVSEHKNILERLTHKFENESSLFSQDNAQTKSAMQNRSKDPFYNLTMLEPTISETPKQVTLKLKIPEYEVDHLQISVKQKEIKLNLTRRFKERLEATDGTVNNSKRSEIISKRIMLPHYLSEKNITKEYSDNVLTIHINKDV